MYNGEFGNDYQYACDLGRKLLPVLNGALRYGTVVQTEHLQETVAKMLDQYSGIDGLYLDSDNKDLSGVALRMQEHSNKNWRTFTIRYKRTSGAQTEYEKRVRQIFENEQTFYPHFTCQAYFNNDNILLGGAFCYTRDLIVLAKNWFGTGCLDERIYIQTNAKDGNLFIVVPFDVFEGYPLLEF